MLSCLSLVLAGCGPPETRTVITLWHQMVPDERVVLRREIAAFEEQHPELAVVELFKETEELRSGFEAAALAGTGPELIYGPSDVLDPYQTMGIVSDMQRWFPPSLQERFLDGTLTRLPAAGDTRQVELLQIGDRMGNHLALVYNRNYIATPPETTDELIEVAVANTIDENEDGRPERYGLVWNFREPFFVVPFITGHGGWLFDEQHDRRPNLDTPRTVAAFRSILSLRDEHQVTPFHCDYDTAASLFKSGRAAMVIDGDWSWGGYLKQPGIDAAIAPLPVVSETGIPMKPLVSARGYSLNANADPQAAAAAMEFVRYMTSVDVQRRFMKQLKTLPSRRELLDDTLLQTDPTLRNSAAQVRNAVAMPVVAELRAVWDAMRPHYQALLGGSVTPKEAAARMQRSALANIEAMNRPPQARGPSLLLPLSAGLVLLILLIWQRRSLLAFVLQFNKSRMAYVFILPSLAVLAATTVFPFAYNVVLSFSNMSLKHFRDWEIIGVDHYVDVLLDPTFYSVLAKTFVWTAVNIVLHVSIGLALAALLNGPIRGKSIYRVLLVIPWAVPAYITALTWRGMFHSEFGAVNLLINKYLGMDMINWLGDPLGAFSACMITNVWLGFPFMMVVALGGMQGIPRELYEAAQIDRATAWDQFVHITLPMLRPVMLPAVTLGTIWTFNNLNVIWLVSNGGEPSDRTHILVSYVYKSVFNLYRYGYGAALSMVIFFILLALSLAMLRRGRATQSVYE